MMKTITSNEKKKIKKAFFNANHAGSYSSPEKIYQSLNKTISLSKIKRFLQGEETYTVTRNIRRKFKKNHVIAPYIDYQYDIDTANMVFYEKYNDYKYILFVIDIFSRYLWTIPLKTLLGKEMRKVLEILLDKRKPLKIRSDGGSEFINNHVENLFKQLGIDHIVTKNETKANYAERVIRTIRDKMGKYMEEKQTNNWVEILPNLTRSYNHTPHRTLGMRPVNVTESNQVEIWNKIFFSLGKPKIKKEKPPKTRKIRYRFKKGDYVRIPTFKKAFEKTSFSHRWTTEIFIIDKRYIRQGKPIYELIDYMRDKIEGRFYENELQKVMINENDHFKIEKILRKRKDKKGKTEYFVKFKGWPKKYNSWVSDIKDI